jgi:flavodoxin I
MKTGIFYGSDTGDTEDVAKIMASIIGVDEVDLCDIGEASVEDFDKYERIIIGLSTWYDGELQSDWEDFFPNLDDIDFTGKTVAIFGLGDQEGYGTWFVDGIGIVYDKIMEKGAKVVGEWATDGYDFDESKAVKNGKFVGLAIDEDNQTHQTEERINKWLKQISGDFDFQIL